MPTELQIDDDQYGVIVESEATSEAHGRQVIAVAARDRLAYMRKEENLEVETDCGCQRCAAGDSFGAVQCSIYAVTIKLRGSAHMHSSI